VLRVLRVFEALYLQKLKQVMLNTVERDVLA
jgi:hypothetical protein